MKFPHQILTDRPLRRLAEVGGWVFLVALLWGGDLLVKVAERQQAGYGKDDFRLISEQVTSALAVLIMVVFVLRWLTIYPLTREAWLRAAAGHLVGSVFFAFGHYVLMILMRVPWYAINEMPYVWRESFVSNLLVEYQKDIKVYLGILAVATLYRRYVTSAHPLVSANRLVVQTGAGKAVVEIAQIEFLEAARNYVSIHAAGREYIVRETLTKLIDALQPGLFERSHRSFVVNVSKVAEIRTVDEEYFVILMSGARVPLSRTYRKSVETALERGPGKII